MSRNFPYGSGNGGGYPYGGGYGYPNSGGGLPYALSYQAYAERRAANLPSDPVAEAHSVEVHRQLAAENPAHYTMLAAMRASMGSPYYAPGFAAAAGGRGSAPSFSTAGYFDDSDDDMMPWERAGWIPLTKSGKQKSPNMIRGELQRFIDQCKLDGTSNQTQIINRMGVNSNSFRKFMDPGTYKDQWSATQNGTYWAAAKLLEELAYEKELAKIRGRDGKRKSSGMEIPTKRAKTAGGDAPRKRLGAEAKMDALDLLTRIRSIGGIREGSVYDTCPQLVEKIKDFLQRDGMTKKYLCLAMGDINGNSLNTFLAGKKQDQCGNITYRKAYVFFEKLRILEGKEKSFDRRVNERSHPYGFSLEKARPPRVLGKKYSRWG